MDIIRITDTKKDQTERMAYEIIENIEQFTLVECRNKGNILLEKVSGTLVLDHFDEAKNQASILSRIKELNDKICTLVLIDSDPYVQVSLPSPYVFKVHIVLGITCDLQNEKVNKDDNKFFIKDLMKLKKYFETEMVPQSAYV